jgi:hypothetical protein
MKTIAIEDLVTIVCTEFVKQNKGEIFQSSKRNIPYLKMNYNRRRKISEKLIDSILGD